MVICRCHNHSIAAELIKQGYTFSVFPIGYPDTAVICDHEKCLCPARVWLDNDDHAHYDSGRRIFNISSNQLKVKVI